MFEDIVEIWEIEDENDANFLLKCGWKILQIVTKMNSANEDGLFHSKFIGVASEIVYVMGRTEKIPARKDRYEWVSDYQKRTKKVTA